MARNHYFTGKLMVERDFTDEQRYFRGKLQRHNRTMHGSGVVCGAKVVQHPYQECQDKFVVIEPGVAVDCCGHEIIVRDELRGQLQDQSGKDLHGVLFNFAHHPKIKALRDANDQAQHTLQFCVRYKECPTEEIPVLYDECGCDETKCAPNRILESYGLDLLLDEEIEPDEPLSAKLEWKHTIPLAHSTQLSLHDGSRRLYVLSTVGAGSAIHAIDTSNHSVVDTVTLTDKAVALVASLDGKQLYVGVATTPVEIRVLDTSNLTAPVMATLATNGATGTLTILAIANDGRLFALFGDFGDIAIWNTPGTTSSPTTVLSSLPQNLATLVFSTDGNSAFTADAANHNVHSIKASASTPSQGADITVDPSAAPSVLAVTHSTAGDSLLVGDTQNKKLYLVSLDPASPKIVSIALSNFPVTLVASPGGNWVYVLENDASSNSFIETVNTQRLLLGKPALGDSIEVGAKSQPLALSHSGKTLYVAFDDTNGGVAILDVTDEDCGELLWQSLEGCPYCATADCIILATIERYNVGDRLLDQTDPPADPQEDDANKIARIDNRTGRKLLPSTQVLTEVVQCVLEHINKQ
jgi:DNA-binding beta-propeller fold protein YncE